MKHTPAFLLLLVALAAPFEVTRSVDRASLLIGDPVIFNISARKTSGQKLIFPGPDASFSDFELRDLRSREEKKGDASVETYTYTLTVFKLGDVKIPAMRVVSAIDTADAKTTAPVDLTVKEIAAADTSDIIDIYSQESLGRGFWFYAIIISVVVLLGALVFLFDRFFRKNKAVEKIPESVLSPEERFEKDMRELEGARLLEKGDVKEFHFRISEVLRRYLGGRLGFEALESTTHELLNALRDRKTEKPALRLVEEFCDINDPVKFAKWIPDTSTSEKLILLSRDVVRQLALPGASAGSAPRTGDPKQ